MVDTKIEEARRFFLELESKKRTAIETAHRNFEIQSRLAMEIKA
jgi:hypothetical protein